MFAEAAEAPDAVRRLLQRRPALEALAAELRRVPPRAAVTLARGSSDNAATVARYAIETRVGRLTSSLSPSIASVYGAMPDLAGALVLAVSQSGRSPDLVTSAEQARARGARVVTLVNDEASPLAELGAPCLPLCAGPERSVAATKSFIASVASLLLLVAEWAEDGELRTALDLLPDQLDTAWALDWSPALEPLVDARHLYVVARGPALGIAQEMALKMKETCGLHAEAFSAAEVRHGPMAIVQAGFPVLLLGQDDAGRDSVAELAPMFAERGATVLHAGIGGAPGVALPAQAAHPALQPLLAVQSFYRMANALAAARGRDPDRPPHLRKVTETR